MADDVQNVTPQPEKPYDSDDGIFLFLAYFGIFSLIPFFMYRDKRDNPKKEYVYFHAKQGLALGVVELGCLIVLGLFEIFVYTINLFSHLFAPKIGVIVGCVLWLGYVVIFLGLSILGWIKAFKGERYEIPVFSKIANMFG